MLNNNTGYRNTGYLNTGYRNTGNRNIGNQNTGDLNTGYLNTGYRNTGNRNTGYRNTGSRNTGYRNTGSRNTGNRNTGDGNTGNRNTGDRNTGYLNTISPTHGLLFNKMAELWDSEGSLIVKFPDYFYFDFEPNVLEWIKSEDMTNKEKENHPEHKITGGFLRVTENEKDIKYWWRKSFEEASHEDIMKTFELPNFDPDIFEEISGISLHNYRDKKETTITISVMGEEKEFKNKQELKDYIDNL